MTLATSGAIRADEGPCTRIRTLHRTGLQPILAPGAEAIAAKVPTEAAPPAPIGQCWTSDDGSAWGLVLSDLKASGSVWEEDAVALEGDILAVHVAANGDVAQLRVGPYFEDPGCSLFVRAAVVTPPGGLLVEVLPDCGEAGVERGARWVVARNGRLIEPAQVSRPLMLPEDIARTILAHGVIGAEFPGGHGGSYTRTFAVPFHILPDGEVEVDVPALTEACEGHAWSAIAAPADESDVDVLLAALGCDWFRGIDIRRLLDRAAGKCPKTPERGADEDAGDFAVRVYEAQLEAPALCHLVEPMARLARTKPPVSLGMPQRRPLTPRR